jgi:hypothetical protein
MQNFTEDKIKRQDFVGRQVSRKSRIACRKQVGGLTGRNKDDISSPGSPALQARSFTIKSMIS